MTAMISEAALHAFHFSRLIPSSQASSSTFTLPSNQKPLSHNELSATHHPSSSIRKSQSKITEADVLTYHFTHLQSDPTENKKPRHSLPIKRTRKPLSKRSSSSFSPSLIHLSEHPPHAIVPARAPSPEKHTRHTSALPRRPAVGSTMNVSSELESDDEHDQLRSSSVPHQDLWRETSSNTSASNVIPSSPLPALDIPSDKKRKSGISTALGMTGMQTPSPLDRLGERAGGGEVDVFGIGGKKGSGMKKARKGPSWVTSTPSLTK